MTDSLSVIQIILEGSFVEKRKKQNSAEDIDGMWVYMCIYCEVNIFGL